jgi:hypothetical protein
MKRFWNRIVAPADKFAVTAARRPGVPRMQRNAIAVRC